VLNQDAKQLKLHKNKNVHNYPTSGAHLPTSYETTNSKNGYIQCLHTKCALSSPNRVKPKTYLKKKFQKKEETFFESSGNHTNSIIM